MNTCQNGILCLTFDDQNFDGWLTALPLFEKYGAHASFFISGELTETALSAMRRLQEAGHTVGLHSLHHEAAPDYFARNGGGAYIEKEILPQLSRAQAAGIKIDTFAYPNNWRNEETDRVLSSLFRRFRAGSSDVDEEYIYLARNRLPHYRVMHGYGVGEYYRTEKEDIRTKIRRAAEGDRTLTFFSHNICENADSIHMPTALLKEILTTAHDAGMQICGFDELP